MHGLGEISADYMRTYSEKENGGGKSDLEWINNARLAAAHFALTTGGCSYPNAATTLSNGVLQLENCSKKIAKLERRNDFVHGQRSNHSASKELPLGSRHKKQSCVPCLSACPQKDKRVQEQSGRSRTIGCKFNSGDHPLISEKTCYRPMGIEPCSCRSLSGRVVGYSIRHRRHSQWQQLTSPCRQNTRWRRSGAPY